MWLELIRVPAGATLQGRPPRAYERVPLASGGFSAGAGAAELLVPGALGRFTFQAVDERALEVLGGPHQHEVFDELASVWTGPGGELTVRRVASALEVTWPAGAIGEDTARATPGAAALAVFRDALLELDHPLATALRSAEAEAHPEPPRDWLGALPWHVRAGTADVRWAQGFGSAVTVRGAVSLLVELAPLALLHLVRSVDLVLAQRDDALDAVHEALARCALPWLQQVTVSNAPHGRAGAWERRLRRLPLGRLDAVTVREEAPLALRGPDGRLTPLPTVPGQRLVLWGASARGLVAAAQATIVCHSNLCTSVVVQHPAQFTLNGVPRATVADRGTVLPLIAGDRLQHDDASFEIVPLRP